MHREIDPHIKELINNVEQAVNSFAFLQDEHEASIAHGNLKKLTLWGDQRARVFAKLQHALEQIWKCENAHQDQLIGTFLQEKIGKVIEKEQQLFRSCTVQKDRLAKEMSQARRGKKVLGQYGPSHEGKGPRFLSSRL